MTQPGSGGEPSFQGQFVTPDHPEGEDFGKLSPKEQEGLKKALKKLFDEERADLDKRFGHAPPPEKEPKQIGRAHDSRGNYIASHEPLYVAMNAPAQGRAGEQVSFSASATTGHGPATIDYWGWDFGNGRTARGSAVTTVFERPGTYLVTVYARDFVDARGSQSRYVEILPENPAPPARRFSASSETADGIRTFTFTTEDKNERVLVYTTDDIGSGDTYVVGHVTAEAQGHSEEELTRNKAEVTGTVVELSNSRTPATEKTFRALVPFAIEGGSLSLVLRDQLRREVGRTSIPTQTVRTIISPPSATADDYKVPKTGIAGRPVVSEGVFSEHTRVSIGDQSLQPFVASPRKYVVTSPEKIIGPTTIRIEEGNVIKQQEFRNLAVETTIDQNELARHQTAELHLTVRGLQNLTQPITINLTNFSKDVVSIEGGNDQQIRFGPGGIRVGPDGIATINRKVKAIRAGNFRIDATLPHSETYGR